MNTLTERILEALGIDLQTGDIHWPVTQEDCPNIADAYFTLYSLAQAEMDVSFYDETGDKFTQPMSLAVTVMDCEAHHGPKWRSPPYYFRMPLKALLEKELQIYIDEDTTHYRQAKLLARLIKAFEEPE